MSQKLVILHCFFPIFFLYSPDPIRKFQRIRNSGGKENQPHVIRQHDDDFLPNYSSFGVVDVVDFVENDPFDVSNKIGAFI